MSRKWHCTVLFIFSSIGKLNTAIWTARDPVINFSYYLGTDKFSFLYMNNEQVISENIFKAINSYRNLKFHLRYTGYGSCWWPYGV